MHIHEGESVSELQSDPRWQLIERILHTAPFQKSAFLHTLLSYLAKCTISERLDTLAERQIGIAVFGKPAGYSPTEDSIVRVHIRQLRIRLHEYFALDGRAETLLVDIPKGSYLLEFKNAPTEPKPLSGEIPPSVASEKQIRRFPVRDVLLLVTAIAAAICAIGWYRARTAEKWEVPWPLNAVIQPGIQTKLVVSDGNTMMRLLGDRQITLDQYLQPSFRDSLVPPHPDSNVSRLLTYISHSQLTSFADAASVASLIRFSGPLSGQINLCSARDLNRRDLEHGNFVFIGSPTSNPWVSLFVDRLNFEVEEDGVGGKIYFRNKKPLTGEQDTYEGLVETGSTGIDYATLALLPSGDSQGNILIFQGLREEGTEALSILLSDTNDRASLARALGINDSSRKTPYFEALIRTRTVVGAPVSIDIVATRIIQR